MEEGREKRDEIDRRERENERKAQGRWREGKRDRKRES